MSNVAEFPSPAASAPEVLSQSASPLPAASSAPKTAIQIHEEQFVSLVKQREQAIGTLHSIEGAMQYAQHMIGVLKREAAKALESPEARAVEVAAEQAAVAEIKQEIESK